MINDSRAKTAGLATENAHGEVPIESEADIGVARKAVRDLASQLGFGVTDVTRIVTAASDLARNSFLYAGSGQMRWQILENGGKSALELVFADLGPGITDIQQAMEEGYTSTGDLGMGLAGTKRLMDEMEICSELGKGTTVTVRK